ncbi:unnamed protein product [Oreochromis niloticus]|nr:unnamed protein product [Mustela putorius furo]
MDLTNDQSAGFSDTSQKDQKIITVVSGQDVTLTCRAPNDNITVVRWSRADLEDEDIVLLNDNGQFVPDEQDPSFKNRVDLQDRQMKDGDVSLILKDVTTADSGTYNCRVIQGTRKHFKLISIIYLRVDPPKGRGIAPVLFKTADAVAEVPDSQQDPLPGLVDGSSLPSKDQKIITESGQDATLTCRAPNNNNRLVEWIRADQVDEKLLLLYQNGLFVRDNQHPSFKNRVDLQDRQMKDGDVSLILKDVTINDAGTYECRVLMGETWSWKFSTIYLHVVDPPVRRDHDMDPAAHNPSAELQADLIYTVEYHCQEWVVLPGEEYRETVAIRLQRMVSGLPWLFGALHPHIQDFLVSTVRIRPELPLQYEGPEDVQPGLLEDSRPGSSPPSSRRKRR